MWGFHTQSIECYYSNATVCRILRCLFVRICNKIHLTETFSCKMDPCLCIASQKKPCPWLSTKRGTNEAASHIGQQKTLKPASGRQCIARETQCLSWSFLMIGIPSIFLKLFGIPIFLGFVYSLLNRGIDVYIIFHVFDISRFNTYIGEVFVLEIERIICFCLGPGIPNWSFICHGCILGGG